MGFTIFAEPDEVLKKEGINTFADLVARANQEYANCKNWYSYVEDKGINVSTGNDYTNQWNALNMIIRYHILHYALSTDKLVYSYNELKDMDVYEYVRTLLPGTMFKLTGIKDPGGNVGEISACCRGHAVRQSRSFNPLELQYSSIISSVQFTGNPFQVICAAESNRDRYNISHICCDILYCAVY